MLGSNLALIQRFRNSLENQPKAEYSFFSHISAGELESIDVRQLGVLAAAIVTVATSQGLNRGISHLETSILYRLTVIVVQKRLDSLNLRKKRNTDALNMVYSNPV